ncbi:MAG: lipid A deacylase LpxR family protein [Desulfobacterales bacterium]
MGMANSSTAEPRHDACLSEDHRTFSLYMENDAFVGDDDQYSNGLKFTWSRFGLSKLPNDAWFHKWLYPAIRLFGFDRTDGSEKALSFSIGQNIFTPDDIKQRELIKDDRPYAGITYAELGFHKRTHTRMHTLGLCTGIVGPNSYAENMQSAFHDILDCNSPKGWDNQLKNEPVLGLIYDYKNKLLATGLNGGFGNDMTVNTGGVLGNATTFYHIGLFYRWGWNIPADYGNFPIQPASCLNAEMEENLCLSPAGRCGVHLFFSANGRAVLRDIFLDGNTFRDSHSVDKKPFVGTFMTGIGFIGGSFKTVLAYVYQTESFEEQKDPQVFGSVSFAYRY